MLAILAAVALEVKRTRTDCPFSGGEASRARKRTNSAGSRLLRGGSVVQVYSVAPEESFTAT